MSSADGGNDGIYYRDADTMVWCGGNAVQTQRPVTHTLTTPTTSTTSGPHIATYFLQLLP